MDRRPISKASSLRALKFTREGKYFVALTLGIGFAAINTGNNLLYLMLSVLLTLIIGSGVLSEICLQRLRVARSYPPRLFANRPFLTWVKVCNDKRRAASFSLEIEDLLRNSQVGKKCFFLKIPAGNEQRTSYRQVFKQRGHQHYDRGLLKTRFPFGLFEKRRSVALAERVLVYPEVTPIAQRQGLTGAEGTESRARPGRRGEYLGLRDYREGDDPRDIFWRKSARVGRTLVREHEDVHGRQVTIFLDNFDDEHGTSSDRVQRQEQAISRAASLAVHLLNCGHAVRLLTHSDHVPAGCGSSQVDRILTVLALTAFVGPAQRDPSAVVPPPGHIYVGTSPSAASTESSVHRAV